MWEIKSFITFKLTKLSSSCLHFMVAERVRQLKRNYKEKDNGEQL